MTAEVKIFFDVQNSVRYRKMSSSQFMNFVKKYPVLVLESISHTEMEKNISQTSFRKLEGKRKALSTILKKVQKCIYRKKIKIF